jgi:hypothetical protein
MSTLTLPPHLLKLVESGESGLNIMHGELKNLMLEQEQEIEDSLQGEGHDLKLGYMQALVDLYQLTYALSFAIGDE